jgi:hypothetical protein
VSGSIAFNTTGHTAQNVGWESQNVHFVATQPMTKISFLSRSASCAGPLLDFVRLSLVGPTR